MVSYPRLQAIQWAWFTWHPGFKDRTFPKFSVFRLESNRGSPSGVTWVKQVHNVTQIFLFTYLLRDLYFPLTSHVSALQSKSKMKARFSTMDYDWNKIFNSFFSQSREVLLIFPKSNPKEIVNRCSQTTFTHFTNAYLDCECYDMSPWCLPSCAQ